MTETEPDPVYEAVAAAAAAFVGAGVSDVVISPGSRSTPLALGMHAQGGLETWIQFDERSAAFFALGMAKITGRPTLLVCTSGTAVANYLPAVVEAHHGHVPLVVITADRPPDVRGWGTNQTIDQVNIFGTATRWATSLAVGADLTTDDARAAALNAVAKATGTAPGPTHINWPLRKPLEPRGEVIVEPVASLNQQPTAAYDQLQGPRSGDDYENAALIGQWAHDFERGLIVVGPVSGIGVAAAKEQARQLTEFATATGWPIIADPASAVRFGSEGEAVVVTTASHWLGHHDLAEQLRPDAVILTGHTPTATPVLNWLLSSPSPMVALVDPGDQWAHSVVAPTHRLVAEVPVAFQRHPSRGRTAWTDEWAQVDEIARIAAKTATSAVPITGPGVMEAVLAAVSADGVILVSNSMPIRDLDGFVPTTEVAVTVLANRGAAGIDGITSTALGAAAASSEPAVAVLGDVALVHDLSALLTVNRLGLSLTLVVIDNGGGAIFDNLPIAQRLDPAQFDTLFRTPPGLDLVSLGQLSGVRAHLVATAAELTETVRRTMTEQTPGCDLVIVQVDSEADLRQHRDVSKVVADQLKQRFQAAVAAAPESDHD